jgi:hypothetical protein
MRDWTPSTRQLLIHGLKTKKQRCGLAPRLTAVVLQIHSPKRDAGFVEYVATFY